MEILVGTSAISNLIREGKLHQIPSIMQTGQKFGMQLLNDALLRLVEDDIIEPREAYLKAVDKESLEPRLRAAGFDV